MWSEASPTISDVGRWMDRYQNGDRVDVWTEMTSLGTELRSEDMPEAFVVVRETMRRVRQNVERLVELLPAIGYVFDETIDEPVFEPPAPTIELQLDGLEARVGRLPMALRGWYEEVGRVNLAGRHPRWEYEYHDPLVVDAPVDFVLTEYDAWEEVRGTEWDEGPFTVDLAPDYLHKANYSGGPPYALEVPNIGVDGLLLWEPHQTTFVNYLRIAFRWGGCPGWSRGEGDGWARPTEPVPRALADVANELLPI
jgi:hypothetical protein